MYDCFREYTEQNLAVSKVLKPLPREAKLALNGYWKGKKQMRRSDVLDNQRWLTIKSASEIKACKHTLRIIMIDPEIILEQVVINPDNNRYSYFGASLE